MKSKITKKCTWLFGLIAAASAIGGGVNLVNASAETTTEQTAVEQAVIPMFTFLPLKFW